MCCLPPVSLSDHRRLLRRLWSARYHISLTALGAYIPAARACRDPFTHRVYAARCFDCSEGSKLDLFIASERFVGMKLLDRHRLINDIVTQAGLYDHIHALTIKAWTPEEWDKKKDTIPQTAAADAQLATSPR